MAILRALTFYALLLLQGGGVYGSLPVGRQVSVQSYDSSTSTSVPSAYPAPSPTYGTLTPPGGYTTTSSSEGYSGPGSPTTSSSVACATDKCSSTGFNSSYVLSTSTSDGGANSTTLTDSLSSSPSSSEGGTVATGTLSGGSSSVVTSVLSTVTTQGTSTNDVSSSSAVSTESNGQPSTTAVSSSATTSNLPTSASSNGQPSATAVSSSATTSNLPTSASSNGQPSTSILSSSGTSEALTSISLSNGQPSTTVPSTSGGSGNITSSSVPNTQPSTTALSLSELSGTLTWSSVGSRQSSLTLNPSIPGNSTVPSPTIFLTTSGPSGSSSQVSASSNGASETTSVISTSISTDTMSTASSSGMGSSTVVNGTSTSTSGPGNASEPTSLSATVSSGTSAGSTSTSFASTSSGPNQTASQTSAGSASSSLGSTSQSGIQTLPGFVSTSSSNEQTSLSSSQGASSSQQSASFSQGSLSPTPTPGESTTSQNTAPSATSSPTMVAPGSIGTTSHAPTTTVLGSVTSSNLSLTTSNGPTPTQTGLKKEIENDMDEVDHIIIIIGAWIKTPIPNPRDIIPVIDSILPKMDSLKSKLPQAPENDPECENGSVRLHKRFPPFNILGNTVKNAVQAVAKIGVTVGRLRAQLTKGVIDGIVQDLTDLGTLKDAMKKYDPMNDPCNTKSASSTVTFTSSPFSSCSAQTVSNCNVVCTATVTTTPLVGTKRQANDLCTTNCGPPIVTCGASTTTSTSVTTTTTTSQALCDNRCCKRYPSRTPPPVPTARPTSVASHGVSKRTLPNKNYPPFDGTVFGFVRDMCNDWSILSEIVTVWSLPFPTCSGASPVLRCDYPSYTSAVYSHSCIPTVRSFTQYNNKYNSQFLPYAYGSLALTEMISADPSIVPTTSFRARFTAGPFNVCFPGLYGCTMVIVVSRKYMWMAHFIENRSVYHPDRWENDIFRPLEWGGGGSDIPQNEGLRYLYEHTDVFAPNTYPKAFIVSPLKRKEEGEPQPNEYAYPNVVSQIQATLNRVLPVATVVQAPYCANCAQFWSFENDPPPPRRFVDEDHPFRTPFGKVLVTFDFNKYYTPKGCLPYAGYEFRVGEVENPFGVDEWAAFENQIPNDWNRKRQGASACSLPSSVTSTLSTSVSPSQSRSSASSGTGSTATTTASSAGSTSSGSNTTSKTSSAGSTSSATPSSTSSAGTTSSTSTSTTSTSATSTVPFSPPLPTIKVGKCGDEDCDCCLDYTSECQRLWCPLLGKTGDDCYTYCFSKQCFSNNAPSECHQNERCHRPTCPDKEGDPEKPVRHPGPITPKPCRGSTDCGCCQDFLDQCYNNWIPENFDKDRAYTFCFSEMCFNPASAEQCHPSPLAGECFFKWDCPNKKGETPKLGLPPRRRLA
ncbi:hypothetical protein BU23DRAFT_659857 [Bimuria novae-zelandiae CBS 107.79]|uniref:Uncharacterized protein n=1 Tax=Bimuria novae-zelandiae CBS 107.79 TaxID=1447943 RepID=A0A6A5VLW4_9PLEO|nr:hypothetical protein BU23DRAFT_659857 [Bimuria novae-zelandiae CBS 107.79]